MKTPTASSDWQDGTLADLCSLITDSAMPAASGAPIYVGLEHIESGAFGLRRSSPPAGFKSNSYRFNRGDVLYGKLRPYLDKAALAPSTGVCSTEVLVLRPKPKVPAEFVLAILHSPEFIAYAQTSADKQYPRTSWNWISQYACRRPSDPVEQEQIAAVLTKVQAAVEVEGELIRVTSELKRAALRQFFSHGLRGEPQKQTDLGPIPESWGIKPVGELCSLSSGGTPDRSNIAFWKEGTIPWVKTGEVDYGVVESTEEHITELGLKNSAAKLFPAGTLIMAMYGQGITRGRVARLGIEATTNQACAAVIPKKDSRVTTDYLYYFFTHAYERLRALGHGANQKNLNLEIIRQVAVPLPRDEDEQLEIAGHLAAIDAKLAHHEARQKLLRGLFRTLLRDLMTGKRRVGHLNRSAHSS